MSTLTQLKKQYKKYQEAYYEGKPRITDREFDKLEDQIRELDPDWAGLKATGTNKIKKQKIKLPFFMPSLNKAYPDAVGKWLAKNGDRLLVADKLDGSSVIATYKNGRPVSLITRGNGIIGQDISFLIPHTNLPQRIKHKQDISFRMEAIMKRRTFESKFADQAENARNLVAGILNRKLTETSTKQIKYIDFMVLGIFDMQINIGLLTAESLGFNVVNRKLMTCSAERLSKHLKVRLERSEYEMDGLVLVKPSQNFQYRDSDKPKWSVAFKENLSEDEAPEVKVLDVIWQASAVGRLTPKVKIDPIRLDGVTVSYATAHNAQWIAERGIGVGAVIKIVRSGGVIPKIVGVAKPARKPKLPNVEYEQRGVHFWATEKSQDIKIKNLTKFLMTCGVERIKQSTVEKLYTAGMNSIEAAARIAASGDRKLTQWLAIAGFKGKSQQIISKELQKLLKVHVIDVMVGSGIWEEGLGRRRLEKLAEHISLHSLIHKKPELTERKIAVIPGFGTKTAKMIVTGIPEFKALFEILSEYIDMDLELEVVEVKTKSQKWTGYVGCWTGYRDKQQEQEFVENGGTIAGFSGKTTHLFYKPGGKQSSKVAKAGDRAITWEQFKGQK